eukprot:gene21521-27556_t
MRGAIRNLLAVMVICLISFVVRTTMLVIKLLVIEMSDQQIDGFHAYGLLWWCLADFLPRTLPTLSFVWFFGRGAGPSAQYDQHSVSSPKRSRHQTQENKFLLDVSNSVCSDDLDASLLEEDEEYLESGGSRCNSSAGRLHNVALSADSADTTCSTLTFALHAPIAASKGGSVVCNTMQWSPSLSADAPSQEVQQLLGSSKLFSCGTTANERGPTSADHSSEICTDYQL